MGERAIQNRIRRLQELDRQQAEIEAEREKLKDEIKKDMQKKGIDQVKAGNFIVRCKKIISNRFDSKRFRADHEDLYKSYQKKQAATRNYNAIVMIREQLSKLEELSKLYASIDRKALVS